MSFKHSYSFLVFSDNIQLQRQTLHKVIKKSCYESVIRRFDFLPPHPVVMGHLTWTNLTQLAGPIVHPGPSHPALEPPAARREQRLAGDEPGAHWLMTGPDKRESV